MKLQLHRRPRAARVWLLAAAASLGLSAAQASNCPGDIEDESRADVISNPSGYNYDVYYTTDAGSDQFSAASAADVRDSIVDAHNTLTDATRNFAPPYFSDDPQDTCISDSANIATAPEWGITVDSPNMDGQPEPYIRAIMGHEMFHHGQYAYIDFDDWPSWGAWSVEGTARAMEDKMWLDNDTTPMNTLYLGEINGYLANPNRTIWDISYTAALFWTYLAEQLGTPLPEPARGVDFIQRFWSFTAGRDPDGVGVLRDTIASFTSQSLESLFIDFAVTNYTHDLDTSTLGDFNRWQYFDETVTGGGTAYDAVDRDVVTTFNTPLSDSVVRWGARYFEVEVPNEQECEAVGFWGKTKNGKAVGWALIGIKDGNQVTEIYRSIGAEFYRAMVDQPTDGYEKLALVVIGLNDAADFDYAFGFGPVSGEIRRPTMDRMAYVGTRDDPERFQARLRMLGPSVLTPSGSGQVSLRGLDATLFDITVRSVATGNEFPVDVINASYVSGEYWMVLQAPAIEDPVEGDLYDLVICYCERSGNCTQVLVSANSVLYADITLNQMLVVDTSGSMDWPAAEPKIEAARNAASLYVDSAADDDRIGLVQFNGNNSECDNDANVEWPLSDVSTDRENVRDQIGFLSAGGWTSIGDGIKEGRNELYGAGSAADVRSLVVLSDGLENEGDFWANSNGPCATPPVRNSFDESIGGPAADQRVDTIAFGADADQTLLQNIASFTGGDFYAVSTDVPARSRAGRAPSEAAGLSGLEVPNRLANVYRTIEEDVAGQDRLFSQAEYVPGGGGTGVSIAITEADGGGVVDGVFAFNWDDPGAGVDIELRDPDGAVVDDSTAGWTVNADKTNKVYRYDGKLDTGNWEAAVQADSDIQLLSMLSGRIVRGVDLEVYFSQVPGLLPQPDCLRDPLYTYLRGLPVLLVANLNDSQGGIGAATVEAVVDNPDRTTNRLVLFDDGLHDDGLAGDGIYANRYTKTPFFSTGGQPDFPLGPPSGQWGSYGVLITASGESNYREQFSRSELRSFQVFEFAGANSECDPDLDDDELPDRWEDLYGLDKMDPFDAVIDHDGDGLDALTEFKQGGHPFDADTDDGGEADGSELEAGRDMLYTRDDALPEIVDYGIVTQRTDLPVHEPVPETNILHFPVHPSYRLMHVYRTDPAWPGFQRVVSVDLTSDPRGVYYDRPLINGFPYSYYLVAEGLSGARTASTAVFSNTPAADPLPPKGWIKLNGGLAQASSFNVVVDVDTSDDSVEMMLSEDAGFDGAVWVPIASGFGYALTPQAMPATRTLYARFRDAAGNVSIDYHDTIEVTAAADNDGDNVPDVADNCTLVPNPTQLDTNGDGFGNICDADLDNDLVINFSDLAIFKGVFFTADPDADFDGNGSVNFTDLGVLKQQFFGTPGPAGPVP